MNICTEKDPKNVRSVLDNVLCCCDTTRTEKISQLITEMVTGDMLPSRLLGVGGFFELMAVVELECSTPSGKQQLQEWSRCNIMRKEW